MIRSLLKRLIPRRIVAAAQLLRWVFRDREFSSPPPRSPSEAQLLRFLDGLMSPLTFLAAVHMKMLRRCGLRYLPRAKELLLARGVWPIVRHYYEPAFPADLTAIPNTERPLSGIDLKEPGQIALLETFHYQEEIKSLFLTETPRVIWGRALTVENDTFRHGDIDFYYSLIRHLKPAKIIEIGAGVSTMVARCALEANARQNPGDACSLVAIEPYPWFKSDGVTLITKFVENVDPALFCSLQRNDILFIDSSHMIRPRGDVLHEQLEILPRLAPGVVVHLHDIFTPFDYPRSWGSFWNEQYLLEAFLTGNDHFEIIGALHWLRRRQPALFEAKCPLIHQAEKTAPWSFWIRRTDRPARVVSG